MYVTRSIPKKSQKHHRTCTSDIHHFTETSGWSGGPMKNQFIELVVIHPPNSVPAPYLVPSSLSPWRHESPGLRRASQGDEGLHVSHVDAYGIILWVHVCLIYMYLPCSWKIAEPFMNPDNRETNTTPSLSKNLVCSLSCLIECCFVVF